MTLDRWLRDVPPVTSEIWFIVCLFLSLWTLSYLGWGWRWLVVPVLLWVAGHSLLGWCCRKGRTAKAVRGLHG